MLVLPHISDERFFHETRPEQRSQRVDTIIRFEIVLDVCFVESVGHIFEQHMLLLLLLLRTRQSIFVHTIDCYGSFLEWLHNEPLDLSTPPFGSKLRCASVGQIELTRKQNTKLEQVHRPTLWGPSGCEDGAIIYSSKDPSSHRLVLVVMIILRALVSCLVSLLSLHAD